MSKAKNEEQTKVDKLTEQSHDLENDVEEYEKKMKELDAKEKAQEAALQKNMKKLKRKQNKVIHQVQILILEVLQEEVLVQKVL